MCSQLDDYVTEGSSGPHIELGHSHFPVFRVLGFYLPFKAQTKPHLLQQVHTDPPVECCPQQNPNCLDGTRKALSTSQPHTVILFGYIK